MNPAIPAIAPVKVGLVGAGQWARTMHAPLHTSGQETTLTGIWSANFDRAAALAAAMGVPPFRRYDELLEASEAVDFAVPPNVQATLALEAAAAGKALMLEKPLATSLASARELADAIEMSGVANIVVLTKRYHERTRTFIENANALTGPVRAITGRYVHGGFLDTGFVHEAERNGWRRTFGELFDLGPHLLDIADAAAGSILSVDVTGDPEEVVTIRSEHEGGAVGQFVLSGRINTEQVLTDVDVYSNEGLLAYSTQGLNLSEATARLRSEFASAVRLGTPVTVDAQRALQVQRIVEAAARSFSDRRAVHVDEETF